MRPTSPNPTRQAGFTLVELLVATAVLVLLLVTLLQILDGTMRSSRTANQQIDAIRDARMSLDVLCTDLDNAVTTDGARILLTGSGADTQLAFLTRSRGPSTPISRFLSVSYTLSPAGFTRSYAGVEWDNSYNFVKSATSSQLSSSRVLSTGILAWSISALMTSGSSIVLSATDSADGNATETLGSGWRALRTRSLDLPKGVRSLQVTMAAMDEKALQRFSADLDGLRGKFDQPSSSGTTAATLWNEALNSMNSPARSSIRVLSKTVDLP